MGDGLVAAQLAAAPEGGAGPTVDLQGQAPPRVSRHAPARLSGGNLIAFYELLAKLLGTRPIRRDGNHR